MVKNSPSNAGGVGSTPGREAKIPHVLQAKNSNINNRNNIVTNSIKTSKKIVHIKENLKKNYSKREKKNLS